jgi:hypothetical protein
MRILSACSKEEVLGHWKQVDRFKNCPHVALWRKKIWSPLPANTRWYNAEIEEKDLERIFIISSDEWSCLSQSFKLVDVVRGLEKEKDTEIARRVVDLIGMLRKNPHSLDRKLTLVSPSLEDNFTMIDGNKRSIALCNIGKLIGNRIYLGMSTKITDYPWAERAMLSHS